MTLIIEPMINLGKPHTRLLPDNWTVITNDRSLSAQREDTVLVTNHGVEIPTLREDERLPYSHLALDQKCRIYS